MGSVRSVTRHGAAGETPEHALRDVRLEQPEVSVRGCLAFVPGQVVAVRTMIVTASAVSSTRQNSAIERDTTFCFQ